MLLVKPKDGLQDGQHDAQQRAQAVLAEGLPVCVSAIGIVLKITQ